MQFPPANDPGNSDQSRAVGALGKRFPDFDGFVFAVTTK